MTKKEIFYMGIYDIINMSFIKSIPNNNNLSSIVKIIDIDIVAGTSCVNESKLFYVIYKGKLHTFPYSQFQKAKRKMINGINELSKCKEI